LLDPAPKIHLGPERKQERKTHKTSRKKGKKTTKQEEGEITIRKGRGVRGDDLKKHRKRRLKGFIRSNQHSNKSDEEDTQRSEGRKKKKLNRPRVRLTFQDVNTKSIKWAEGGLSKGKEKRPQTSRNG